MKTILEQYENKIFEDIKHIDEFGNEYWLARELQNVLEYKRWQKFINVIVSAKKACEQSKFIIDDHFTHLGKMVGIGSKTSRSILDNMGSEELAANLFRITQTESKLKRDNVYSENVSCETQNKIGKIVRNAIKEDERCYA